MSLMCGVVIGGMRTAPERVPLQAMVIDEGRNSGAYASTLFAVDANGSIQFLDTSKGEGVWTPWKYSPKQTK